MGGGDLLWIVYQDDGRADAVAERDVADDADEAFKLIYEQLSALDLDRRTAVLARVKASFPGI